MRTLDDKQAREIAVEAVEAAMKEIGFYNIAGQKGNLGHYIDNASMVVRLSLEVSESKLLNLTRTHTEPAFLTPEAIAMAAAYPKERDKVLTYKNEKGELCEIGQHALHDKLLGYFVAKAAQKLVDELGIESNSPERGR